MWNHGISNDLHIYTHFLYTWYVRDKQSGETEGSPKAAVSFEGVLCIVNNHRCQPWIHDVFNLWSTSYRLILVPVFLTRYQHHLFRCFSKKTPTTPHRCQADEQLRTVGAWRYGCTATVCLVRRMPQSVRIHVARCSRCWHLMVIFCGESVVKKWNESEDENKMSNNTIRHYIHPYSRDEPVPMDRTSEGPT